MKLNKIGEVWNSANSLLGDFFGLLSSKNLLPWQRDVTISPIYWSLHYRKLTVFKRVLAVITRYFGAKRCINLFSLHNFTLLLFPHFSQQFAQ